MSILSIDEVKERLTRLRECESAIAAMLGRKSELEVDTIVSRVIPETSPAAADRPEIDEDLAARLVSALERRDELRIALGQGMAGGGLSEEALARHREAVSALELWLAPPEDQPGVGAGRVVPLVVLAAIVVAGWAAWAIHLAMLLILVPVGVALSFFTGTGHDAQFRQVGARRRFDMTALEPPGAWEEASVRERIDSLQDDISRAQVAAQAAESPALEDAERRAAADAELESVEVELYGAAVHAGLDPDALPAETLRFLREISQVVRAKRELAQLNRKLRSARSRADESRADLFKALASAGLAPADGGADTATLAQAVQQLIERDNARRDRSNCTSLNSDHPAS